MVLGEGGRASVATPSSRAGSCLYRMEGANREKYCVVETDAGKANLPR